MWAHTDGLPLVQGSQLRRTPAKMASFAIGDAAVTQPPTPRVHLVAILLLSGASSHADVLWMKNGDRLSGKIEAIDAQRVQITLPYGAPLRVDRAQVVRWRIDSMEQRKLASSQPAPAEEKAASQYWHLSASTDLSAKLKRNSSNRDDINLVANSELTNRHWRFSLLGNYNYETSDGQTKSHDYELNPKADFFLSQQWFWRSALDYNYDLLSANYLSVEYSTGAGYRFWNDRRRRLEWVLQSGIDEAYWQVGSSSLDLLFENGHVRYPFLSMGWDYRQPLLDNSIEAFSTGSYFRYLHQPSDYVQYTQSAELSLGLRYYLTNHLRLSWRSELKWEDLQVELAGSTVRPTDDIDWRHYLSLGASY